MDQHFYYSITQHTVGCHLTISITRPQNQVIAKLVTWNAEESAKFHNVGLAGEFVSVKSIISTEQTPQLPFHAEHPSSEDAPTMKLVFSHEWTLHLELAHLSSCTTQGQIQGENDYAIDKVSTTITTRHYRYLNEVIFP